jgi:hypothetical protein
MSVRITFPKMAVATVLLGAVLTLAPATAAAAVFSPDDATTTPTTTPTTVTPNDIDWP